MENSFKKLDEPSKEPPKSLKKSVVKNISSIKLITDMFELFFYDFAEVAKAFFKKK